MATLCVGPWSKHWCHWGNRLKDIQSPASSSHLAKPNQKPQGKAAYEAAHASQRRMEKDTEIWRRRQKLPILLTVVPQVRSLLTRTRLFAMKTFVDTYLKSREIMTNQPVTRMPVSQTILITTQALCPISITMSILFGIYMLPFSPLPLWDPIEIKEPRKMPGTYCMLNKYLLTA